MSIKVEEIITYPLKSGKGVHHRFDSVSVHETGLEWDRSCMLVHAEGDLKGTFISQRTKGCSGLSQVKTNVIADDGIHFDFSFANGIRFRTPWPGYGADGVESVSVWKSDCHGIDGGDEAAYYFSEYLDMPVRLIFYPLARPRLADPEYGQHNDITSFADGYPVLITSSSSFISLREHFEDGASVTQHDFRPNIILSGAAPFEEDIMHHIRIGQVEFEIVKPCARCIMTTINQETGETGRKEPLQALANLRRGKGEGLQGVFFGQNAIPRGLGTRRAGDYIKVGDEVEVISARPVHNALKSALLSFQP